MRVMTIVGARPQFVKAATVSLALKLMPNASEILVHTGQHFDENMSAVFFDQLGIPAPQYRLDIHGGNHGVMTGRMLEAIEELILREAPDRVLVYGDTNSTLAGALAAVKLHVPVAHVEAGLRSFNMRMPEEVNRILTDRISDTLFCPTRVAVKNLENEGFRERPVSIVQVGDVMNDAALKFASSARKPVGKVPEGNFILATIHRAENTDDTARLTEIVRAVNRVNSELAPVVLPLHPRTRRAINDAGLELQANVIQPVGYLEMLWLLQHTSLVLTDSGGVQKEAYFFGKPCVTMRDQTEWVELVDIGANLLAGADEATIVGAVEDMFGKAVVVDDDLYGGGGAAGRIAEWLVRV